MTLSSRGIPANLAAAIRAELTFVLWVTLLGPAAYIAALTKELGSSVSWAAFGHHYLIAVAHFFTFSASFGFGLVWYRNGSQRVDAARRRRWGAVISIVAVVLMAAALGIVGPGRILATLRHILDDAIITAVVLVVERIHYQLVITRMQAKNRQLQQERERRAAAEARWFSLESRVRPHFLFNTLSSIRELMYRDVREAGTMIQRFADLLRFSLESERRAMVPLYEEMRIVEEYLEIERMRLGRRLRWKSAIDPACRNCSVPALSILTLVENALKHAIAPQREGGALSISGSVRDRVLTVEVADDGPGFTADAIAAGHGLDLLLQRLETRGGGDLRIRQGAPGAIVTLTLPGAGVLPAASEVSA